MVWVIKTSASSDASLLMFSALWNELILLLIFFKNYCFGFVLFDFHEVWKCELGLNWKWDWYERWMKESKELADGFDESTIRQRGSGSRWVEGVLADGQGRRMDIWMNWL